MKALRISVAILISAAGAIKADVLAYATTGGQQFGVIDLTTGTYSNIGNSGQLLTGLGTFGGDLYSGGGSGAVYQINPSTGQPTPVITSGGPSTGWVDFGSTTASLYGIDGTGVLYSIDPTSDAVTLVGSLGLGLSGTIGLSTGSGSLYFTQGGYLYQIDTSTGAASLIGPTGIGDIGGLVYADGTLYGGQDSSPVSIATLDPTSGAGSSGPLVTNSQGGPLGLAQLPDGGVRQFDDIAVVPEPSFVGALGLGLLATGWFAYRRHKRTA